MRGAGLRATGFLLVAMLQVAPGGARDENDAPLPSAEAPEIIEDEIIVTASRTEQRLTEAPAAVTVLKSEDLETLAADDYGDLLRGVPGVNVTQLSAREVQITPRSATGVISKGQLALVDGRTVYLDFLGFVLWDFLPANVQEISQIEVVRGPASAVWGANAMTGVVNVLTKSPWEARGTRLTLGVGELDSFFLALGHARVGPRSGVKLTASYYEQAAYNRPTGFIPGQTTRYPDFENEGTEQPQLELRFDYQLAEDSLWNVAIGWAATDGISHSGTGPADIERGSGLGHIKTAWSKGSLLVTAFANILDGDAVNLLLPNEAGRPSPLRFETETYNADLKDARVLAEDRHILTCGANARLSSFDVSTAPNADDRTEFGLFIQDEILFGPSVRWLVGARLDSIDPIGTVVSPRTSLMLRKGKHNFRISFNRAFRVPSIVQNYLDLTIFNPVAVGVAFETEASGKRDLSEERLDAVEVGWVGDFGRTLTAAFSIYRNETSDLIDLFPATHYLDGPFAGLPRTITYRNVGKLIDKGIEVSARSRRGPGFSWFLNYSFQDRPEVEGIPLSEVNLPPRHRANVGFSYDKGRLFLSGNANYQDDAVWTDVLDSRFHGPTNSFVQVNASVGLRFRNERTTLTLTGNNVFDDDIQQHVFGDIISRKIAANVRFAF